MSPLIPQKGEHFTLKAKYLLFILTIICIGLIILSFNTDLVAKPLNAICSFLVTPLENGISNTGHYLSKRKEELAEIKTLLSENERLKDELDKLTNENVSLQQDRYELNNLRDLYELDTQYDTYEKTGARVIAKDSGNWYHSFTINKGSSSGIEVDMNVMAGSGLVGRVISVGPNWAKVMSIIDDGSNISAMVLSTSDNLIVSGDLKAYDEGCIPFEMLVDKGDRVAEGDKIVTSNISDKYLPGILIGYISSVEKDSNNLTKSGLITPAVDFEHLDEVLIVLGKKEAIEEE